MILWPILDAATRSEFECQLYGKRKPSSECALPANETRSKNQIQDKNNELRVVGGEVGGGEPNVGEGVESKLDK